MKNIVFNFLFVLNAKQGNENVRQLLRIRGAVPLTYETYHMNTFKSDCEFDFFHPGSTLK